MVDKVVIRGLLVVLALVIVGACSSAPQPCDPVCLPGDTTWPCACGSPTAMGMLNQIDYLAQNTSEQEITQQAKDMIHEHAARCLAPGLIDSNALPDLDPNPCAWLSQLYGEAHDDAALYPPLERGEILTPEQRAVRVAAGSRRRWETIATDLSNFPGGPIQSPR